MKFTTQDLGPLRTVTLPAAKWELVRRALGSAGFALQGFFGPVITEAAEGYGVAHLPTLEDSVQREANRLAREFIAERPRAVEQEIEVRGIVNDNWEVLAVGEDWATCRDTTDGEVAVWFPGEVHDYTPPANPKAPEHRVADAPYEAEVICSVGHAFGIGDRVTVYPDRPCKVNGAGLTQYLRPHQLRPL